LRIDHPIKPDLHLWMIDFEIDLKK